MDAVSRRRAPVRFPSSTSPHGVGQHDKWHSLSSPSQLQSTRAHGSRVAFHACDDLLAPNSHKIDDNLSLACCLSHSRSASATKPTWSSPCTKYRMCLVLCSKTHGGYVPCVKSCIFEVVTVRVAANTVRAGSLGKNTVSASKKKGFSSSRRLRTQKKLSPAPFLHVDPQRGLRSVCKSAVDSACLYFVFFSCEACGATRKLVSEALPTYHLSPRSASTCTAIQTTQAVLTRRLAQFRSPWERADKSRSGSLDCTRETVFSRPHGAAQKLPSQPHVVLEFQCVSSSPLKSVLVTSDTTNCVVQLNIEVMLMTTSTNTSGAQKTLSRNMRQITHTRQTDVEVRGRERERDVRPM